MRFQFGGLHVRCEQPRKTLGIAARHTTFGGDAVDPDMAPGGSEASSVAIHIVAMNEAEIELGFRVQLQSAKWCEIVIVSARFRHRQVEELDNRRTPAETALVISTMIPASFGWITCSSAGLP